MDSVKSTTSTTASAGSTIVSKLSSGSGIDSAALITQLADVSKAAQTARLTTRKETLDTQISDYGLMRSELAKLDTAAKALNNPDTFNAKSVAIPETNLIGITKLDAKASSGEYKLKIEKIAQSQSVSSAEYASVDTAVGKGTLAIRFGEWNGAHDDFTVDAAKTGATITIDDSNNSLTGLKDAINAANIGVQASIVGEDGAYKLLITAPSGAKNEIDLTAVETPGALGLANFNYNEADGLALDPLLDGVDAEIRVNGLLLTRASNHVTDVIDGLEFDLFNESLSEVVSINIAHDRSSAETAIRDFVAAYNTFLTDTKKLVGYDEEKKAFGSLRQDPLSKSLITSLRSILGAPISGSSSDFSTLGAMGIRTRVADGHLEIIEDGKPTDFNNTLKNNFEAVRDFFVPKKSSDNSKVTVTGHSAKSVPGTYAVNITTNATKGFLNGGAVAVVFPFNTLAGDYSFKIKINDIETATIALPANKNYASGAELAADFQSLINLDSKLVAAKVNVSVGFNANRLEFTSNDFGSASKVAITAVGSPVDMANLGLSVATGTNGIDVAGTVGGVAAFGYGNVLLPAIGSNAEGLSMKIGTGATTANITFSKGFATSFNELIDNYTKSSGLIKNRENNINKDIKKVEEDQKLLDRRTEAYKARLQAQFSAMEGIVRSLKSIGSSLDGILDRLPFTSKNN